MKTHVERGTHVPDPVKIPRLWRDDGQDEEGPRRQSSTEEVAAFFGTRLKVRYMPKEES